MREGYSPAAGDAYAAAVAATPASAAPSGTAPLVPVFAPERHSGPEVARAFQRAFAAVLLIAWVSLASQVRWLAGSMGLAPAAKLLEQAAAARAGLLDLPTLFWLSHDDGVLVAGTWLGALLALLALLGFAPRLCFALSAPLYLSYAVVCSDFLAFQWDNLLIESALLAACLPAARPSRLAHFALRLLLFKLYFESGIAKWQSHLHDWQDGSAMVHYYETAPLPAWLAFYAHHLPAWFHALESRGALLLELPLPFLIFGPRRARLLAFAALTAFQIINTLTANYGFFTYMTLALHLFLLSDADIARVREWIKKRFRTAKAPRTPNNQEHLPWRSRRLGGSILFILWSLASLNSAWLTFHRGTPPARLVDLEQLYGELRVANVYHLFGHITLTRIEPQFETHDGGAWHEHDLWYKPGDLQRRPPYVAPHQPRVDFRLWFFGLSFQRGMPGYVQRLLTLLCEHPDAVQPLFTSPLPEKPDAVRISFHHYQFATPEEHARTGAYWTRETLGAFEPRSCQ